MIHPGLILQNRYRVVKKIGDGGFGETFEVDDQGTPKVLKVLKISPVLDEDYRKAISLFQREAQVLSRMHHPGIPKVEPDGYFTFAPSAASEPFHCLVMEKIDGHNLQEWLENPENQTLTHDRACDWLKQLLEILDKLHDMQYFHRDIKPANIMLKPDGQLVLIDFGAVREISETYLGKLGGKREVTILISFNYTPPEQFYGLAVPQSDFFALGRTFVHLLTGQEPMPLMSDTEMGELNWRDFAPDISASLADLLDYMMAALPGKRPQNTQVILQRLEAVKFPSEYPLPTLTVNILNPTSAPPASSAIIDQPKPNKIVRLVNSMGFKVGVAGLVMGLIGSYSALPQMAIDLNNRGLENYNTRRLDRAEFFYRVAIALNPKLMETKFNLGLLYDAQQNYDRARAQYQIAKQANFDKAYSRLGRLEILDNKCDAAVPLLLGGLKLAEDDTVKAALYKNLGWALLCQHRYNEATERLQMAIALDKHKPSAAPHCLLAQVLERQGNAKQAQEARTNCLQYPSGNYSPEEDTWKTQAKLRLEAAHKILLSQH